MPFSSPFTSRTPSRSAPPSSAARAWIAWTPFTMPWVWALFSSSIWLSCWTTVHRWFMSVCWPPEGRPLTRGMPFCCAPPPLSCEAGGEGEGEGPERGMLTLPVASRKE
jgi:hypothetical protein